MLAIASCMKAKRLSFLRLKLAVSQLFLNMQTQIYPATLNLGLNLEKLIALANETYPATTPTPQDSMETIMYKAGQRSVVEWLETSVEEDVT